MSFFSRIQLLNSLKAIINPATEDTLALIKLKTNNLDVALSTRTKPADQQHAIVDSSALPAGASTEAKQDTGNTSLASIKTNTDKLDVNLSTVAKATIQID